MTYYTPMSDTSPDKHKGSRIMAATIKTENKTARQDTFRVVPSDIKLGRNSRMVKAPNYAETVKDRAVSIATHGQLQPAEVRRLDDKTLELVYGFTRYDAVQLLRDGFTAIDPASGEEKEYKDEKATLWVKVTDSSPDEAFVRSIAENVERKDTTDLQDALAQNELRTTLGWSDTKIARFYGKSNQNRVMDLEKLLRLPEDVQQKVHKGDMALSIALLTLDLTEAERADLIERSADAGGKVSGVALKSLLRDLLVVKAAEGAKDGDSEGGSEGGEGEGDPKDPKTPSIKRSVKDLERFLQADKDAEEPELSVAGQEFFDVLMLWFKGKRNDAYLTRTINEYLK